MSDSTWALIEMRNNLKKDIEATPVCSRSALESKYKTKNREVMRSTRRDKRSHIEKRNYLKVLKRQHLSVIWEKFIKSPRS